MPFDVCEIKPAVHPYRIESIGIDIYTIEELCYYLHENLYLLDQSIIGEKLVDWIRKELGLSGLAKRLSDALERPDRDLSYFLMPIFSEIGYLDEDEQRRVRDTLTKIQVGQSDEREKLKADYLLKSGRFLKAETIYSAILEKKEKSRESDAFVASVWNNLGCSYALQFRFREAADCYFQAWECVRSREYMRKYVSALPLFLSEEEYRKKLEAFGADRVLISKMQEYNAGIAQEAENKVKKHPVAKEDIPQRVNFLCDEYRRCVSL